MRLEKVVNASPVLLAVLSLVIPFVTAGDRTLATFVLYIVLALAVLALSLVNLRRWSSR